MKIFTTSQIRTLDQVTIEKEPIASIDLMERASEALFEAFIKRYDTDREVLVFAGNGNNGGDALALARLLAQLKSSFDIRVFVFETDKRSADCQINLERLDGIPLFVLNSERDFPVIASHHIVVDGILGTGLDRPVVGLAAGLIAYINKREAEVFAIDIPSGLFAENNTDNAGAVLRADVVVSFQFPKLAFLLSDKSEYVGEWEVWDIGLHQASINKLETSTFLLEEEDVLALVKPRHRFSHKGTYGHALLIAGKAGMMGAAILAAKSCLRSGVGLVTTHVPRHSGNLIQSAVPEALLSIDRSELMFTDEMNTDKYTAIGVGPGIGTAKNTVSAFYHLISNTRQALVIDADGLNLLSDHKEWLSLLSSNTILTPHPKEFDRLTRKHNSAYDRWQTQLEFVEQYGVIVVLKGAHTSIAMPDGRCFFNSTGNAGMASGGVGDVLTGIMLGLLSQGYVPEEAALLAVWWHGKAADRYAEHYLEQTLIASDVIDYMKRVSGM